ncbi:asparagine-tRNA ligase (NARS1) [Vairimorpha necatrix]|uniref:asparagine--tRNA ligase n=1 Tax=Vairimorpha necatrix TaxID=6039 RepID=A0AAX4J8M6_9MICR
MTNETIDLENMKISEKYEKIELVKISKNEIGKSVQTFGWVDHSRTGKAITFFDLICQFKTVKCVYESKIDLTKCTSLTIFGVVQENKSKKEKAEFEILVHKIEIYNDKIAPSFPLNKESSFDTTIKYGHLALRNKPRGFFLKARSALLRIIRDIYYEKNYIEITPPTIVQTQVEGGSTLFKLKYYEKDAYLTQSSQLYLETVAPVAYRAFCIAPSYRAEKSNTTRHLSEYTHVESEMANIALADLMDDAEYLVSESIKRFYDLLSDEIKEVYPDIELQKVPQRPFKRIRYSEAIKFLNDEGVKKDDGTDFVIGDDIPDSREKIICERFGKGEPVFMTHFLVEHKPFYMKLDESDKNCTESFDLLYPGIGEIVGGSMRLDKYDALIDGFKREGLKTETYDWYLDMAKYGPCQHGGYGLGFERLMMAVMKYTNIEFATLYPRNTRRCHP